MVLRTQRRQPGQFVTNPVLERNALWEDTRRRVLERLEQGPARVKDLAGDASRVHDVIRSLRDEGAIHADSGYWVLGPSKRRQW